MKHLTITVARINTPNTENFFNEILFLKPSLEGSSKVIRERLHLIEKGKRVMVTKGQRRLGRTIRKLENSVELSSKESGAKEAEKEYREKAISSSECAEDAPVQSLRDLLIRKENSRNAT